MMNADETSYQAELYRLMAQLLRFPDDGLASCVGALRGMFTQDADEQRILANMERALAGEGLSLQDLEVDYTALFIGAFKMMAPPYASYYLDGERQLGGPSTVAVERVYRDCGLVLAQNPKQPGDHLAVMLEFLFELLRRSVAEHDPALENQARAFFRTYVMGWVGELGEAVRAFAKTPFYAALGELLPLVLVDDSLLL